MTTAQDAVVKDILLEFIIFLIKKKYNFYLNKSNFLLKKFCLIQYMLMHISDSLLILINYQQINNMFFKTIRIFKNFSKTKLLQI